MTTPIDPGGNGPTNVSELSADGRFAIFESMATNIAAPAQAACCESRTGHVTTPPCTAHVEVVSLTQFPTPNLAADGNSTADAVTPDGRYVVFSSAGTNVHSTYSATVTQQVYVRDRVAGAWPTRFPGLQAA